MDYLEFIKSKQRLLQDAGFECGELPDFLYPFQRRIVRDAVRRGRYAVFAECGLGKTPMQLVWADAILQHTGKPVLILSPLAVAAQTVREGHKFGYDVHHSKDGTLRGITITNYEHIDKYYAGALGGIVLDESSILKNYAGKLRKEITEFARQIPYRLSATATPAPNDFVEYGTQAEFLSVGTHTEMLSTYFVHDGGDTSSWRLKKHAVREFKRWLNQWSVTVGHPSELGDDTEGYTLPELVEQDVNLTTERPTESLFEQVAIGLSEQRAQKKKYASDIADCVASIANSSDEQFIVWVENNYEADALKHAIRGAVEIRGSDTPEHKETTMLAFSDNKVRVLITKPSIAGHGMNWQNCHNMIFASIGHSYEQRYQAVRRCYRFGQLQPVNVYTVRYPSDDAININYKRKAANADHIKQMEA